MKHFKGPAIILISLALLSFRPYFSIDDVAMAIQSGNANQLSRYLDNRVDISLPEKTDTYSKTQAEMVIRDFFVTNGVQGFQVKHKGENGGSEFCVGLLKTRNGDYRTVLFMKLKGDRQLLQEIRFQSAE